MTFNSASTQKTIQGFWITQGPEKESLFDEISVSPAAPPGLDQVGTYAGWSGNFTWNGNNSPQDNPNNNNLVNLQEYAFGFQDPITGTHHYQTGVAFDSTGPWLSITYRRNLAAEDVRFIVQRSSNLVDWTDVQPAFNDISRENIGGGNEEVTVNVPADETIIFLRLKNILRVGP